MFYLSKLTKMDIDFPKLKYANDMFYQSKLKSFSGSLESIEETECMFMFSMRLKDFNPKGKMLKLKKNKNMFIYTTEELKNKHPYLFV